MTCHLSGTVAVTSKVAVSAGCSLTGYQAEAPVGSPATKAPPDDGAVPAAVAEPGGAAGHQAGLTAVGDLNLQRRIAPASAVGRGDDQFGVLLVERGRRTADRHRGDRHRRLQVEVELGQPVGGGDSAGQRRGGLQGVAVRVVGEIDVVGIDLVPAVARRRVVGVADPGRADRARSGIRAGRWTGGGAGGRHRDPAGRPSVTAMVDVDGGSSLAADRPRCRPSRCRTSSRSRRW